MEQKKYNIFDTKEDQPALTLRLTSNKNIRRVVDVLTSFKHADFQQRLHYARALGEVPIARDENGEPETNENGDPFVEFEDKYLDSISYWCALAEALFVGCPTMGELDDDGVYQLRDDQQELIDGLIRSAVRAGLEDFLGQFGLKLYKGDDLSNLFQIDQNLTQPMVQEAISLIEKQLENENSEESSTK